MVGGENVLRFSPRYPQFISDFSTTDQIFENAQKTMYALDLSKINIRLTENERDTLKKLFISDIHNQHFLKNIVSYFDATDGIIRDGFSEEYTNLVTFSGVLKYDAFPLSAILIDLLNIGENAIGCPVEIEFAVNLNTEEVKHKAKFAALQIRPLIVSMEQYKINIDDSLDKRMIFLRSNRALGHGVISTIKDVLYVKPDSFDSSKKIEIAEQIEVINEILAREGRQCILMGPGRWGTQDHWLGIPVHWGEISQAKVIVETDLIDFRVKPSQGTHFLQNIISHGIGYLNIPYGSDKNFIDWKWLKNQKKSNELKYVRHKH